MSDIKNIGEVYSVEVGDDWIKFELASTEITYKNIPIYNQPLNAQIKENSSLITTIESLQKENNYNSMLVESFRTQIDQEQVLIKEQNALLESQQEIFNKQVEGHKYTADRYSDEMKETKRLNAQIESLKAITELAVKGLTKIMLMGCDPLSTKTAVETLDEIERLQNE